jgi:rubrerythrin
MQKKFSYMCLAMLGALAFLAWAGFGYAQLQGGNHLQKPNPTQLAMLSTMPVKLDKVKKEDIDKQILRAAIIAELDAVTLYEQLAAMTEDQKLKALLLDVAKEEKTHVGEFQALLIRLDPEYAKELEHGAKEVEEITGGKK